jgi:MFS family permease
VYAGLYGFIVFFTLYLQFLGFTPFEAGLLNIPSSLVLILLAARFGGLADRHGPRLYLTVGPALIGAGTLVFCLVEEKDQFWTYGIVALLLFSFGLAMMVAPITSTALKSAPERYAGIASGVNSTVSRLGSLVAVALIGLIISLVFEGRTDVADAVPLAKDQTLPELRDASIAGFRAGMVLAAAFAFAGAAVGAVGISNREARGELAPDVSEQAAAPAET